MRRSKLIEKLLPPESPEDALWHGSSTRHSALPTQLPVVTCSVILYCAVVAAMIFLKSRAAGMQGFDPEAAEAATREAFGLVHLGRLWGGDWWGLLGSSAQHFGPIHLLFNLLWLWRLGAAIERAFGSLSCLGLILAAAWVSAGFQVAVTDHPLDASAGMSGVVYAMAGFMWIAWRREPGLLAFFNRGTARFFLGWQLLCFALSWSGTWPIANTAHLSGLVFGLAAGAALALPRPGYRWAAGCLGVTMGLGVLAMLQLGAPWNPTWHAYQAYTAHRQADYPTAEKHYQWLIEHRALDYQSARNAERLQLEKALPEELLQREKPDFLSPRSPFKP